MVILEGFFEKQREEDETDFALEFDKPFEKREMKLRDR